MITVAAGVRSAAGEGEEERDKIGEVLFTRNARALHEETSQRVGAAIVEKPEARATRIAAQVHAALVGEAAQLLAFERQPVVSRQFEDVHLEAVPGVAIMASLATA